MRYRLIVEPNLIKLSTSRIDVCNANHYSYSAALSKRMLKRIVEPRSRVCRDDT